MNNYDRVPNIITGKDLDYLSDMFEWNYTAYKKYKNNLNNIQDEQIKNMFEDCVDTFYNNLNIILSILKEGGNHEQ